MAISIKIGQVPHRINQTCRRFEFDGGTSLTYELFGVAKSWDLDQSNLRLHGRQLAYKLKINDFIW